MFNRLRSSSIASLIDLTSTRPEVDSPKPSLPSSVPSRQGSLNLAPGNRVPCTPSPLSGCFGNSRRTPQTSPQAQRALNVSKKELTEVIELLQQVPQNDLSQTRALLSLMVAILSDTPKSRECMRDNAGFLTLITVLASLGAADIPEPQSAVKIVDEFQSVTAAQRRVPSIALCDDDELLCPTDSSKLDSKSPQSKYLELREERDAVATLVFKCFALALSNHRENQLFFSTKLGYKLVLNALRLSNFIPQSPPGNHSDWPYPHYRRQKIEKLFGILFAFIVADFSSVDLFSTVRIKLNQRGESSKPTQNLASSASEEVGYFAPQAGSSSGQGTSSTPIIPPKLDSDSKYSKMVELLRKTICDHSKFLRVEIADAVLLLFALHADLFQQVDSNLPNLEDNTELHFLSLKAIEILAATSRHSQIALNSIELTAVLLERLAPQPSPNSSPKKAQPDEPSMNTLPSAGLEVWDPRASATGSDKITNRLADRQCRQVVKSIIQQMLQVGTSPREARMLFRQAVRRHEAGSNGKEALDEDYLELILSGMQSSNCPPFIHFGSPKGGCAYATLDSLGANAFPPIQTSGWSFVTWIQIESFGKDPNMLLELLTISDPDEECYVQIAISYFSSIIIQTARPYPMLSASPTDFKGGHRGMMENLPGSSSGSRTIAEFNKVILETDRFYHFAVVQKPATRTSSSTVSLFIDGECIGSLPLSWPKTPKLQRMSTCFGSMPSQSNTAASSPYGRMTPQLSLERPRWNLAGCWLFNRALLDDMLFVMSTLGPKIFTCFQDALGSFQTYSSSTLLNLKIDNLRHQAPKSKPTLDQATSRSTPPPSAPAPAALLNKSPLIKAVKEPASAFIPQTSIYFALSAKNGIIIPERPKQEHDQDDNIHSMSYMQQIYTPIDPPSFDHKANDKTTLASGPTSSAFGPIFANGILNASTPNSKASHYFMDPADTSEYGLSPPPMTPSSSRESTGGTTHDQVLELIGDVKLCSPRRLDDSIWTASGSIFLVRLIQLSSTERQLMMALQIFFEAINHNWRLSEDAEKIQAYETLGLLLRSKAHLITPPVHRVLLCFAGIMVDDSPNQLPLSSDQLYKLSLNEHIPASKLENKHPNKGLRHSVITNPLAFRFLLLDFDLWSSTSLDVQRFHCESLCGMIETSIWSRFSMKRISKMNLLPKMLHALRNRQFSVSSEGGKVIPAYIRLLGCVLKAQFNAQIIRHLASYLTASLTPEQSSKHELRVGETKPDESKDDQEPQSTLSKLNVPVSDLKSLSTSITLDEPILVLKVLHDLLLSPNDQESCSYITQFLKAINGSKWLLMFFRKDTHPEVISYSLRILTRLIQTQDFRWLQHFKNTLAGFTILRSVLAKFCFINETVLVTTLSLLSQVDIRTVPMFSTTRSSDPPGTSPLMFKDDLQGVVRSIRGIPNELVTPEMLPIIIALLKPAYVVRCSEENMTSIYVMEWLNLRMESQDDGWNEMLGDKDVVKVWANYVLILSCVPHQESLQHMHETPGDGTKTDMIPSSPEASCLSSFPLTSNLLGLGQAARPHGGVSTIPSSTIGYDRTSVDTSNPQNKKRMSNRQSRLAMSSVTVSVTVPTTLMINGEMAPSTSPRIPANDLPDTPFECFFEDDPTSTTASLYCYDDALEEVVLNLASITDSFLMNFLFDQYSNLSHSKQAENDSGRAYEKNLRVNRLDQLLNLVINRAENDRAWITPFVNEVIEVIVLQTDPGSVPWDWLISTLADGYLSGWLQPNATSVSQLVTFLLARKIQGPIGPLGDLLLIALTNRHTSSPEVLLEQLCSHHLANLIAAVPPELFPRLVYILTQYLSRPTNLRTSAADVLKLLFSYHPRILEEFYLNIDPSGPAIERSAPLSVSSDNADHPSTADFSMSKVEKDLSKVLQMQPDELKKVLEKSSSINLTGKLDWMLFVTESEMKANRMRSDMQNKSQVMWTEFSNKGLIESRRLEGVVKKLEVWARSVKEIDASRFANLRQDNFDTKHYLEMHLSKRLGELYRPFSILAQAQDNSATYWALDSTEGPSRQRKKLRRLAQKLDNHAVQRPKIRHHRMRSLGASRRDSYRDEETYDEYKKRGDGTSPTSPTHPESLLPSSELWGEESGEYDDLGAQVSADGDTRPVGDRAPKKTSLDQSAGKTNGEDAHTEDFNEDKSRRILKSLEAGDVIQGVWNVEQVIGLDTCPALFLMAKNNIYIIDGFFQRTNGELVNSWDAWEERDPHLRTLASLSRQTAKLNSRAAAHQTRRWNYSDIVSISSRKWLFRDICIEFLFADGRSRLLTFSNQRRDEALKRLKNSIRRSVGPEVLSHMNLSLKSQTELWQNGQITNQAYLLYLNDAAGRTYRDLTQHPVFPWILADYTSSTLDLEKPESFRKLDLPMGAQTDARKRDFIERFLSLEEFGTIGDERMKPAHYMTHYSSAVVVCGFLIRLQPFCDHFIEIQGSFDHADRTFWSIHRAWLSASEQSRSDVRELIPEFFHCPEFLMNLNKLSLGSRQEGGAPIGAVELPPWAHGDPRLFVELHREALESDFVSSKIHHWIDLIFGYKQRGQAALDAVNVFQEVSYEGTVSLDAIVDDRERSSVLGAMCNWGLTPSQIFDAPHPVRVKQPKHAFEPRSMITASTCSALIQSIVPIRDIKQPIGQIHPGANLDKIFVSGPQSLLVPPNATHRLDWDFLDQTLRIFDSTNSLCATFEGVSSEHISSACFADQRTLATGSADSTISLWRFAWLANGGAHLQQIEVLRGHSAPITCIVASRTLSIVVSGAEDGLAMIWDLNRALLVHSLPHSNPVSFAAISESTGDIATCSQNTVRVWSINGDLLSTLSTSHHTTDAITACCWSLAEVNPLLVTGHRAGKLMFWQRKSVHAENPSEPWKMKLVHEAYHDSSSARSEIRALSMTARTLLSGDSAGRLFCWSLPGSACHLPDSITSCCMLCEHKFGILEGKRKCSCCSAIICSSCQDTVPGWSRKCCLICLPKLMKLVGRT
ncbi:hypothetical protein MJO28_015058 [Puccinia striiformis f. sp. tritici]|uniref:Uncharacterized protein n=1 Tax=Puccinia striiformis f. sp. tritici TaxID=168172 RepID=A0ACC0DT88_9BASI|nr:hypothetical protein MJO28_015058 [Puccinia striiformis f. sp. tritici]